MPPTSILTGLNKEETQIEIKDLTAALYEVCERLSFLAGVRGTLADLRVTPTGTVTVAGTVAVSAVTTVSTVANQSAMGGFQANNQIPALMNLAAQANINNIEITA